MQKIRFFLLLIILIVATFCYAAEYNLMGYDAKQGAYSKYLGKIYFSGGELDTSEFRKDSIFNEYSSYGNSYNANSVWNKFGKYGSDFSNYSPLNEYASQPPILQNGYGERVGYLTVNEYFAKNTALGRNVSTQFKAYLKTQR
jgi:hypothetical protein